MEWQKHPLDSTKAERHHYWMTSEDSFAPQDATMVYGAGRLRREAKSMVLASQLLLPSSFSSSSPPSRPPLLLNVCVCVCVCHMPNASRPLFCYI
jgi:hypothetical protein